MHASRLPFLALVHRRLTSGTAESDNIMNSYGAFLEICKYVGDQTQTTGVQRTRTSPHVVSTLVD